MALTIAIAPDEKQIDQHGGYVILDDELVDYFERLEDFPTIRKLGDLDPYGVTHISTALQQKLENELDKIIIRAQNQQLPSPPDNVGMEGGTDVRFGEEFGWAGLIRFFKALKNLLEQADEKDKKLFAIGD